MPLDTRRGRIALALAWAVGLLVASLAASPPGPDPGTVAPFGVPLDKWQHAVGYAVLAVLVARALAARSVPALAVVLALTVGYGAGIELLQGLVPTRTPSLADLLADAAGATLAAVGWRVRTGATPGRD